MSYFYIVNRLYSKVVIKFNYYYYVWWLRYLTTQWWLYNFWRFIMVKERWKRFCAHSFFLQNHLPPSEDFSDPGPSPLFFRLKQRLRARCAVTLPPIQQIYLFSVTSVPVSFLHRFSALSNRSGSSLRNLRVAQNK